MASIRLKEKNFHTYLDEKNIQEKVKEMAEAINRDYADSKPLFIAILNGSFMFASDLFKYLTIEAEICFIKLASYKGTKSTGHVITAIGLDTDLFNRNVIIVEDIVDTGKTMSEFLPQLRYQQPASMKIAALLHKPEATRFLMNIDYVWFTIPNDFVVGYGLDYDGLGRNIPEIYKVIS